MKEPMQDQPLIDHADQSPLLNTGQHTPGPWIGGFSIQGENGMPVCRVLSDAAWTSKTDAIKYGCQGYRLATSESEAVANARLIAAAPELLEALKLAAKLVKTARWHFPKPIHNSDRFELENVNAAICRAIAKASQP